VLAVADFVMFVFNPDSKLLQGFDSLTAYSVAQIEWN